MFLFFRERGGYSEHLLDQSSVFVNKTLDYMSLLLFIHRKTLLFPDSRSNTNNCCSFENGSIITKYGQTVSVGYDTCT